MFGKNKEEEIRSELEDEQYNNRNEKYTKKESIEE